jgi:hypothetical protein
MGDLLGSLVQESQKRTILCYWGGMLQIVSESLPNLRCGGACTKPMKVVGTDAKNGLIP